MALVQTRVDDINGKHDATQRFALLFDGKKAKVVVVDLVDDTYSTMERKYGDAMSNFLSAGQVSTVKRGDLARFLSDLLGVELPEVEAPKVEPTVHDIEARLAERGLLEDREVTTRKLTGKPPKVLRRQAISRRAAVPNVPPPDQRPKDVHGKPFGAYTMERLKRPGIRQWWKNYEELLKLPPYKDNGRQHKAVEEAYDRYQGKAPDPDNLHPVDLERLTAPSEVI